jgi:ubiquinone/menaquinone biosynthesis C-methylase UbiE
MADPAPPVIRDVLDHAWDVAQRLAIDVACGTGVLSKAFADAGAHVTGVDASEGYLEGAHRRRSHPNIIYELGDIRQMRFEDDSFDAAVSTLALDVLPEIEQVVAEMKRVTKPGGIVASGVHSSLGECRRST